MLFEKLTEKISIQWGLGTQHRFKAPGELQVNIHKI